MLGGDGIIGIRLWFAEWGNGWSAVGLPIGWSVVTHELAFAGVRARHRQLWHGGN